MTFPFPIIVQRPLPLASRVSPVFSCYFSFRLLSCVLRPLSIVPHSLFLVSHLLFVVHQISILVAGFWFTREFSFPLFLPVIRPALLVSATCHGALVPRLLLLVTFLRAVYLFVFFSIYSSSWGIFRNVLEVPTSNREQVEALCFCPCILEECFVPPPGSLPGGLSNAKHFS